MISRLTSVFSDSVAFIAGAASSAHIPELTSLPEVIVTGGGLGDTHLYILTPNLPGRANVGKSSLFNAVLGRSSLLHISKKAGHTQQFNFYRVGAESGKLILVDTPGYGKRGRPEWGDMLDEYLKTRKQLRRVYILFNAKHGLNPYDKAMLAHLSNLMLTLTSTPHRQTPPWTIQSVITKADTIPVDQISPMITQLKQDIHKTAPLCLRPIVTSAEMKPPWNIDQLRANIMDACGIGRLVL